MVTMAMVTGMRGERADERGMGTLTAQKNWANYEKKCGVVRRQV